MKKALLSFSAVAALALSGANAFADNYGQLNYESTGTGWFTNVGFLGISNLQFVPTVGSSVNFGAYCTSRVADAAPPYTWNVDQLTTASFQSVNPTTKLSTLNATEGEEVAYIVNKWGGTTSNDQATEVQLAIWDIAEGGTGLVNSDTGHDLVLTTTTGISGGYWGANTTLGSAGVFGASSLTALQTIDQAAAYAQSAIAQVGGSSSALYYEAQRNTDGTPVAQDFVPTPSPEPCTITLGIACVGYIARRVKRNAI